MLTESREQIKTWDDAATSALLYVFDFPATANSDKITDRQADVLLYGAIGKTNYTPEIRISAKETLIKLLRENADLAIEKFYRQDDGDMSEIWWAFAIRAWSLGLIVDNNFFAEDKIVSSVHSVLVRKQHDYGHDNISRFGRTGLIVRMHDKIARLENLFSKGKSSPKNESIIDNIVDVIGYATIGIMLERGNFTLPLRG